LTKRQIAYCFATAAIIIGLFVLMVGCAPATYDRPQTTAAECTAGKEVAALQSRQQYLAVLAEQRHCAGPPANVAARPEIPQ
jgi:hypothetical protein